MDVLTSHFLSHLQNYKEFEAEILDLQLEKYGLSFDTKKCTTSAGAPGDEILIGIRSFNDAYGICVKGLLGTWAQTQQSNSTAVTVIFIIIITDFINKKSVH